MLRLVLFLFLFLGKGLFRFRGLDSLLCNANPVRGVDQNAEMSGA